jgi:hypothetical protein
MPSYLERYLNGEYEAVWQELLDLGPAIREEPLFSDAQAVAHETMRRAKDNVETLILRLLELGYQFENDRGYRLATSEDLKDLAEIERLAGGAIPLALRVWFELVHYVDFCPKHSALPFLSQHDVELNRKPGETAPTLQDIFNKLEEVIAKGQTGEPLLALRPYLLSKSKEPDPDLAKTVTAILNPRHPLSDPFLVFNPGSALEELEVKQDWYVEALEMQENGDRLDERELEILANPNPTPDIILTCDGVSKFYSGSFDTLIIKVPNAAIDGRVEGIYDWGNITFVEYLRENFKWGGFPGLVNAQHPPREILAYLTKDLLPI